MEQPEPGENGPYLQAAFFCERLLEEADGVLSAIRIVDTVTIAGDGEAPQSAPPLINLTLFIAFKAGQARGSYSLTVAMEAPDRLPSDPPERFSQTILFDGADHGGANIIMPLSLRAEQAGVYWFGVYLDGRLVTRLPLRVVSEGRMLVDRPQ